MNNTVIRVENLGKLYRIGERHPYKTLGEAITNVFKLPVKKLKNGFRPKEGKKEFIWALKDVSFEVKQGEVVGIIGRNGAGKSTLLKILSRITMPSVGFAHVQGSIASLLEVGTGFHPELTGRENIYLNGAILGMRKAEIKHKFDAIVAFAGIDDFIDTPVKYYSSGMYVRLAFAVAAHLEPDILMVDEVLAVGDAEFQRKCLGKMDDVAKQGRTVLFISHNLRLVEQLCPKAILLNNGQITSIGSSEKVIMDYMSNLQNDIFSSSRDISTAQRHPDECDFSLLFRKVTIMRMDGTPTQLLNFNEPFKINIILQNRCRTKPFSVAFTVKTLTGEKIFTSHSHDQSNFTHAEPGSFMETACIVEPNLLMPGLYAIDLSITDESWEPVDCIRDAIGFEILSLNASLSIQDKRPGMILLFFKWQFNFLKGDNIL